MNPTTRPRTCASKVDDEQGQNAAQNHEAGASWCCIHPVYDAHRNPLHESSRYPRCTLTTPTRLPSTHQTPQRTGLHVHLPPTRATSLTSLAPRTRSLSAPLLQTTGGIIIHECVYATHSTNSHIIIGWPKSPSLEMYCVTFNPRKLSFGRPSDAKVNAELIILDYCCTGSRSCSNHFITGIKQHLSSRVAHSSTSPTTPDLHQLSMSEVLVLVIGLPPGRIDQVSNVNEIEC
jgi:hypothetical protein